MILAVHTRNLVLTLCLTSLVSVGTNFLCSNEVVFSRTNELIWKQDMKVCEFQCDAIKFVICYMLLVPVFCCVFLIFYQELAILNHVYKTLTICCICNCPVYGSLSLSLTHTHTRACTHTRTHTQVCFIHNDYELIYPHAMPFINPLSIDSAK